MAHPFTKFFNLALKKSTPDENYVLVEAEKLLEKGYRPQEIFDVLSAFHRSLISDRDVAIAHEAVEHFTQYLETHDEGAV